MSKKIAFILESFGVGGVTEVVKNIIDSLDGSYRIDLILLTKVPLKQKVSNINYTFFDIEEDPDYSLIRYLQYAFFKSIAMKKYRSVIMFLNELNPDIIHFHTNPRGLMLGHCLNSNLRTKLLYTDHTLRLGDHEASPLKKRILAYAYKHYYRLFDVTAVSAPIFNNHLKYDLVMKAKTHELIENRIKPLDLHGIHLDNSKIRFIYIARIDQGKGHSTLVYAWSQIKSGCERELILIGPNNIMLKSTDETIRFLGSLTKEEVALWIQRSDIGIFPSCKEGLPLALLEMLAAGLPVIVNDIPELTSIVEDGINGLVYKRDDPEDLACKITQLIEDPELRNKLSIDAQESVNAYISEDPGHRYVDLYNEILSNNKT